MPNIARFCAFAGSLCAAGLFAAAAYGDPNKVVIGDIDDMSGVYADVIGPGSVVAAKMAIADFGGSVLGNKMLSAGFRGAEAFDVEVFEPATTNALMAAMWVHDLRHVPEASAATTHPLAELAAGANHGGLWRVPYLPRSVLPLAALLGLIRPRREGA